jgi:nucleotide-binding universal stress UspA family protein
VEGCIVFQKLLVPLDGTAESAVALPLARLVAAATGAELRLLRVIHPHGDNAREADTAEARRSLERIREELEPSGLSVESTVRQSGSPGAEIEQEAKRWGADLIVMATHGRSGLRRAVLGSVAEHVLTHSSRPLLLVRPGGHRVTQLTTLLVPVDGSPGAALALGTAVPLAQATSARLVLLQVVVPAAAYMVQDVTGMSSVMLDPAWDEEALAGAQQYVSGLTTRLQGIGVVAEGRAVLGTMAETLMGRVTTPIVDAADDVAADIVVMSTHALTGPVRTVVGSTADEVVRNARRPVLLVRQR